MTFTVVQGKGVTGFTVASDRKSMLPPLCQILKHLCYSATCCSVDKGLMQTEVVSALGTVQIMVGLFNLGLAPGGISHDPEDFVSRGVAYWLGGVFIVAGITSVLAGRFPSRCLVSFAVFVNILGSLLAIVGIVMYAIDLSMSSMTGYCSYRRNDDNCKLVAYALQRLVTAMDITMIILAALQLCVSVSFAVLGIKALVNQKKDEVDRDVEIYQPVLTKDVKTCSDF